MMFKVRVMLIAGCGEREGSKRKRTHAPPNVLAKFRIPVTTARSIAGAAACAATRAVS